MYSKTEALAAALLGLLVVFSGASKLSMLKACMR